MKVLFLLFLSVLLCLLWFKIFASDFSKVELTK
jgi:hypothetical protein